jgi:hypothetical protein
VGKARSASLELRQESPRVPPRGDASQDGLPEKMPSGEEISPPLAREGTLEAPPSNSVETVANSGPGFEPRREEDSCRAEEEIAWPCS